MTCIKIVTDSTADIPLHLVEELDITVLPLQIHFQKEEYVDVASMVPTKLHYGKETFIDGITMNSAEFYERLETAIELPGITTPSADEFMVTYHQLKQQAESKGEGVHIISIHLSSALGDIVEHAEQARDRVKAEIDVTVFDSKLGTYGLGMIVVVAAKAARAGSSPAEVREMVAKMIAQSTIFFLVDRLEYLYRSNRISLKSALWGFLSRMKPILSLNEQGAVYAVDKARGRAEAIARFTQLAHRFKGEGKIKLSIAQGQALEEALMLKERLVDMFSIESEDITITDIGPAVGRYVGPKTIGLCILKGHYDF